MFHQHGAPVKSTYKEALLSPAMKLCTPDVPLSKWSTKVNHLLQQSGIKGKIDPNWILLDSQ
eukprot:15277567-Ditylum_brightwellii.AAC.2